MSDDEDEDSQDEHPEAWSPVVIQQRRNPDRVTREDMYSRALQLAKTLANELQNIPLPAFEGYLQVLEQVIDLVVQAPADPVVRAPADPVVQAPADPVVRATADTDARMTSIYLDHSYGPIEPPSEAADDQQSSSDENREPKRPRVEDDLMMLMLPNTKTRAGRPRGTRRLDHHKNAPKPFEKKKGRSKTK
ncbi:uncharacterized protein LOC116917454 [Daphnia magna]|uniref:uncharacterized protein LOC116917454 n=1 Tax=Daphnia magna TaxID=35525 RepID=UPI001E1BD8B9|nr:uncharacterized protein LOC116917454 [Daphnia magna]